MGKDLLPGIDGRSKWARRMHDLIANYVVDLGGEERVTQAQFTLIKAAATMTIILENWEVEFAKIGKDTLVTLKDLLTYQTTQNSLRRTLESLGLDRVNAPRDGTSRQMQEYRLNQLTADERERLKPLLELVGPNHNLEKLKAEQLNELHSLLQKALPMKIIDGTYSR
ncbi:MULTISPECIES: hypothetical protein [unclassified Mesorhizobium]|uniref:hypothetical protein n=1 Tax=unclassified Mesorhizobium TaxID=325217 RepID=UPI000FDC43CF|nr:MULTISPECIES: hypothetical protein [unclassified Mesorhizobium]TGQ08708.1 hypothetical protein EN862_020885 [Mesorhizobium sp. M2E.F.Ca.ET.219.01.1.1]TGT69243.1 hypothetical protein EN809_023165 [Mesorhizobium sp. M2E.F.Ca.ET.166.01.1.1]TGW01575.1 hypothetical protein EN797_014660 [Mesorhizobium sp. M2E.F.Ca.ET.154.01.1.1]